MASTRAVHHCAAPTRAVPTRRLPLCAVVLACVVGHSSAGILDNIDKAVDNAKSGVKNAIDTIGDAFQTTGDWAEGTWEDAGNSLDKATGEVESHISDVTEVIESVRSDPEKAKELLKLALPTCQDIKYIVRRELNATITSTIEDLFRLQKCLEDVQSQACLTALEDTLVDLMFAAMWFPLTRGVGVGGPVVRTGLDLLETPARNLLDPPLGVAADPLAKAVHELLKGANWDTSVANDVVLQVKEGLLTIRDETLRATEANMNQVCLAIDPVALGTADGACQLVPTWAAASLIAGPFMVSL